MNMNKKKLWTHEYEYAIVILVKSKESYMIQLMTYIHMAMNRMNTPWLIPPFLANLGWR